MKVTSLTKAKSQQLLVKKFESEWMKSCSLKDEATIDFDTFMTIMKAMKFVTEEIKEKK